MQMLSEKLSHFVLFNKIKHRHLISKPLIKNIRSFIKITLDIYIAVY